MTVNTQWGTHHLERWVFNQSQVWIDSSGDQHDIEDMNSSHLLNTLLFLERVADEVAPAFGPTPASRRRAASAWLGETPLYAALKDEIYERMTEPRPTVSNIAKIDVVWPPPSPEHAGVFGQG